MWIRRRRDWGERCRRLDRYDERSGRHQDRDCVSKLNRRCDYEDYKDAGVDMIGAVPASGHHCLLGQLSSALQVVAP